MRLIFALLLVCFNTVAFAQSNPPLRVREADGSPTRAGINTLIFPNGSVSIAGTAATITISGGATPAGSNGDIQMNTSGALAASSLNEGASVITSTKNLRVPAGSGGDGLLGLQIGRSDIGFFTNTGAGELRLYNSGPVLMAWNGADGTTRLHSSYQLVFGSSTTNSPDIGLARSAAGVLRVSNASTGFGTIYPGGLRLEAVLEANLGTPSNGTILYCSDCTVANPCASGGTGALAKRLNGVWVCN